MALTSLEHLKSSKSLVYRIYIWTASLFLFKVSDLPLSPVFIYKFSNPFGNISSMAVQLLVPRSIPWWDLFTIHKIIKNNITTFLIPPRVIVEVFNWNILFLKVFCNLNHGILIVLCFGCVVVIVGTVISPVAKKLCHHIIGGIPAFSAFS